MTKLIETYISEIVNQQLKEKAVAVEQAPSTLCLEIMTDSYSSKFILFDEQGFFNYATNKLKNDSFKPGIYKEIVYGYIVVIKDSKCGYYSVSASAAKKGYGPLMYDIAMSHIHPHYLTSDRQSVSSKAQRVWDFMLNKRENDFDIQPIRTTDCKYGKFGPESEILDYKFRIKNKINIDNFLSNKTNLIEKLKDNGINHAHSKYLLTQLGNMLFSSVVDSD